MENDDEKSILSEPQSDTEDFDNFESDNESLDQSMDDENDEKMSIDDESYKSTNEMEIDIDDSDSSDSDDDDEDEIYKKLLNTKSAKDTITKYHPESVYHNYDEIQAMTQVVRDNNNKIIDPFHKTIPVLTKYEKARILGQRAKQIDNGSKIFVAIDESIIDSYVIANMELKNKKLPFIIKRPLPGGSCEYWNVKDLELLEF